MDVDTKRRIEETVVGILQSSDIDAVTEQTVRDSAAAKLGLDLSDLPHKVLVRQIVESFLLSIDDNYNNNDRIKDHRDDNSGDFEFGEKKEGLEVNPNVGAGGGKDDWCRVICKLSNKRDVAIKSSRGEKKVAIRDFYWKDGKPIPSSKSISLPNEQWSIFKDNIPAIEEAIAKVESIIRSQHEQREAGSTNERPEPEKKQFSAVHHRPEPNRKEDSNLRPEPIRKRVASHGFTPVEVIRFDGKNYHIWAERIELFLNQLNLGYVLTDPCPSTSGVPLPELPLTISAMQNWIDDDYLCRQNILNSLSDPLFDQYSKKTGTAKELWEELKIVYLYEEHGSNLSLVKKYIEFQMVEDKSVYKQAQQFHQIADSLTSARMFLEEKFHVTVTISKLPPSWKGFGIQLMMEDYLPVSVLMNHLKVEEDSRAKGNRFEITSIEGAGLQHGKKLGPNGMLMKKPGVRYCSGCRKKGHSTEQCWFRKPGDGKDNSTHDQVHRNLASEVPETNIEERPIQL